MRAVLILACLGCCLAACSAEDQAPTLAAEPQPTSSTANSSTTTTTAPSGAYEVTTEDRTLTGDDPPLFVRIWTPEDGGTGTRRLIVLAHGLAGEPDKFDEL